MPKPTREERIRAYTKTAGGCSSCYAGQQLAPLTYDQLFDTLNKWKEEKEKNA